MNWTPSPPPKLGAYTTPPANQPQPLFIWKPKGYLGSSGLIAIFLLALLVMLMILARIFAMPGMLLADWPLLSGLGQLGSLLNNGLTLTWVPVSDRDTVIYLLLLP
ncbi:MAG: hypothetical protein EBU46_17405, partial [Nitrosomonadaceae bacterium]|nr:hypothetical protein [Nitrosomonadaceae bacterium]